MNQPFLQFDLDSIREIAILLRESELGEICLETTTEDESATRLLLRRAAVPMAAAPPFFAPASDEGSTPFAAEEEPEIPAAPKTIEVNSLAVGVFREAKVPVRPGDGVKARQMLGSVESLRVPNEICCPADGRILEISTSEGQGVEYGQTLFVIEEA